MIETKSAVYQAYTYAYPHKSAYRPFAAPIPLKTLWSGEEVDRAFVYVHVPFCEMRCGFCNLFTMTNASQDQSEAFVAALARQISGMQDAAPGLRPARMALGGGTPTWLRADQLDFILDLMAERLGADASRIPCSVETSPQTSTPDRLALLSERGVERISIGVQSFVENEARAMGRPQKTRDVEAALDRIRDHPFRQLNVDLIYGAANQTVASWLESVRRTLRWRPEEVFLYPLYVRPLTGLDGRSGVPDMAEWDAHRLALYRAGRDALLEAGYIQTSMRRFALADAADEADVYCCQDDGMIGLGPGARSYTRGIHYSTRYGVKRQAVSRIVQDYIETERFDVATYGAVLTEDEQMRRHVLQSVLHASGLDPARFHARFGRRPFEAFPVLRDLVAAGMLADDGGRLTPTAAGLEQSDAIGLKFYSEDTLGRMAAFELQ